MKRIKTTTLLLSLSAALGTAHAAPKESPTKAVEKSVQERTGLAMRWEQDAAAREERLQTVRRLLAKPLNLNSAVQIALLNNRGLQATFEELGISAADLREAGMWKNPSFDLSVRFPDRAPSAADWEEAVAFDLLDLFMLPLRKRVAADQLTTAQLRVADEVVKLVAEVKSAVYTLQADETILRHRQSAQDAAGAALQLAQKQHEAGNINDLMLSQQQAAYDSARLETAMVETTSREHREKLNRLLSLWGGDTGWKLPGHLPALPKQDINLRGLESLAVAQRLDLAAAQQDLASLVRALGLTKSYRYIGALEFGIDTERNPDRSNVTGPTLRLEIPLFNRGEARVAKSEAQLRRAESQVEGLAIDLRAEVRELHDRLAAKREIAEFYRDQLVPGRRAISAAMLLQYNGMLLGNYELFTARGELAEVEQKAEEASRDYWITRAELERAVGGNLRPRAAVAPSPLSSK